MSLILEALRKSEAERRRGLAPDLFVELPPVVRPRDSTLSPALWLLIALAVLAITVWLARRSWSPPMREEVAPAVTVPDDASRRLPPRRSAGRPAVGDAFPRSSDALAAPTPATDAMPATVVATPSMAPGARPTATPPGAAAQELPAVPPPASVREPLPPQARPEPVAVPEPAAPPTPVPPAPGNAAILQLADLPAEQRKQLPPLRISMHMWDQDPARRFVIIDGARLREGDRVGDAVIEQITADSVLLDWNGRRLHLPLLR